MTDESEVEKTIFYDLTTANIMNDKMPYTIGWFSIHYDSNMRYRSTEIPAYNVAR